MNADQAHPRPDEQLVGRVEAVERALSLLAETLGVDLDRFLLLADCDCSQPRTWEEFEACGLDPQTGAPVEAEERR